VLAVRIGAALVRLDRAKGALRDPPQTSLSGGGRGVKASPRRYAALTPLRLGAWRKWSLSVPP